ncbi:MrcB family domain-containing protein [Peribacillus frigoritolerans]|uniref:MrcB family domain-containing protein n=1 Tax=Peribacillus frigoritolerans TaxID=450367 RepID=UPI003CFF0938
MDSKLREYFLKISSEYLTAKSEGFGGNAFASFVRHDVPKEMSKLSFLDDKNYSVAASAGKGNWATVPWISILNNEVTNSTQRGYYLVYLFSEDMKRLYLSFSQGVTETSKEDMLRIKKDIRGHITMDSSVKKDDNMFIGDSNKAKQYADSTAAYIEYNLDDLPSETELVQDLKMMVGYYEEYIAFKSNPLIDPLYNPDPGNEITYEKEKWLASNKELINHIHSYITAKGFFYTLEEVTNLFLSLKTKPFVILSGISGTGKTKIVQWFAESVGATEDNGQFTLIPIRPDWNDGSDLLGYVDIKGDFKPGPFTTVIEKAEQNPDEPYFVLLDEMNLARVEHYFSDVLSVMESRKWEDGKMVTSALLSAEMAKRDIKLPVNLYVIGTVNMDETTHPFSKKVLDRANTIEFNRVELSNLAFLEEQVEVEPKLVQDHMFRSKYLHLKDLYLGNQELVKKVTAELEDINKSLQLTNAHIGYRVRDEICFYLAYNEDSELMSFENAFDHCILQKILPRISGSDTRVERLLEGLYRLFTTKEYIDDEEINEISIRTARYPKSAGKVVEMLRRLQDDGFTSFWIS